MPCRLRKLHAGTQYNFCLRELKMEKNLIGLHSLRGLAAIAIVIFHTFGINNLDLPVELGFIKNYFGLGVPLFFVISAFSLFLSTTPRIGRAGWLYDYLIRRLLRIAPLFYFMIAFYCFFVPWEWGVFLSLKDVLVNIFFLFGLMPGKHESVVMAGWTIGVEMIFYLLVPYLLVFITKGWHTVVFLCSAIAISAVFCTLYQGASYPAGYAYMSFMGSIGVFAYGIPAYFAFKTLSSKSATAQKKAAEHIFIFALAILIVTVFFGQYIALYLGSRSSLWGAFFALLIVSQSLKPIPIIANRAFAYLGNLSFGLYLCHPPLVYLLKPVYLAIYALGMGSGSSFIMCAALTIILVIPLAKLLNVLIERPGVNLGELVIKKRVARDNLKVEKENALRVGCGLVGE